MDIQSDSSSSISDDSIDEREPTALKNLFCKEGLFYLRLVGLWSDDGTEPSRFSKLTGYLGALNIVATLGFLFTLLAEDMNGEVIAKFLVEVFAEKTLIFKVLPIILNRHNILKIWQKTYQIHSTSGKSLIEKEVADKWDRIQLRLIKILSRSYIASLVIYLIIPWLNGTKFPVKGSFPQWSKDGLWFYLIYTITTASVVMRSLTVAACALCHIIAICRLFRELQQVQQLIGNLEKNNRETLRSAIIRHVDVLDYGRMICDNFCMVYMLQYFDFSISICFMGVVAIYTSDITLIINLITFMILYVSQLAIICYTGEKLMQESLKIARSIDNSYDNFLDDVPSLKSMSMILMRAQKPLKFNIGSTSLSLSFYALTINTIYSFFMIFKSMIN